MSDLPTNTDTDTDDGRPQSKLMQMCIQGSAYREDHDFEMFGETVTVRFKPLLDPIFLEILTFMKEHLDIDVDEDAIEATEEEIERARTKTGEIDLTRLDGAFVRQLQRAMVAGVVGSYDGDEFVEHTEEDNQQLLNMVGGYSPELGMVALDVSGNVRDATKFRGSRGGQRGFSAE